MNRRICSAGLLLLLCASVLEAQEYKFHPGAEIRPRILWDGGYQSPHNDGSIQQVYISQRTRLNADFSSEKLKMYVSVQDVRIWGDDNSFKETGMLGNTESLMLHQGWFRVAFDQHWALKAGLQILAYDDQRILSSRNWNDYQVTYDALVLQSERNNSCIDLVISWNAQTAQDFNYSEKKFKTLDFIRYEKNWNDFTLAGISLVTGNTLNDSVEEMYLRGTWGLNFNYLINGFQIRSSGYFQHHINKVGGQVSAFCFSVYAGNTFLREKMLAGAGLDLVSGNEESTGTVNHRFDLLYGARHRYYGAMDYFSKMPDQGLEDFYLNCSFIPNGKLDLQACYHWFFLDKPKNIQTAGGKQQRQYLGGELDLQIKRKVQKAINLEAGYSFFSTTPLLKTIKGVESSDRLLPWFFYLMVEVKVM